jgi:hypothetical protein
LQRGQKGTQATAAVIKQIVDALPSTVATLLVVDLFSGCGDWAAGFLKTSLGSMRADFNMRWLSFEARDHFHAVTRARLLQAAMTAFHDETLRVPTYSPMAATPLDLPEQPSLQRSIETIRGQMKICSITDGGALQIPADSDVPQFCEGVPLKNEVIAAKLAHARAKAKELAKLLPGPKAAAHPPAPIAALEMFDSEVALKEKYDIEGAVAAEGAGATHRLLALKRKDGGGSLHLGIVGGGGGETLMKAGDQICGCGTMQISLEPDSSSIRYPWRLCASERSFSAAAARLVTPNASGHGFRVCTVADIVRERDIKVRETPELLVYGHKATVTMAEKVNLNSIVAVTAVAESVASPADLSVENAGYFLLSGRAEDEWNFVEVLPVLHYNSETSITPPKYHLEPIPDIVMLQVLVKKAFTVKANGVVVLG